MKANFKPFKSLLLLGLTTALTALPVAAETLKPHRAEAVRQSFGVNTHINYSDGAYAQLPFVIDALQYIGITHIRDHSPIPWIQGAAPFSAYEKVLNYGIKFTAGEDNTAMLDPSVMLGQLAEMEKVHPGGVVAIEGFNEVDRNPVKYKGLSGFDAARTYQKDFYQAIKAHPLFKKTPVLDFSGDDLPIPAPPEKISGRADYLNFHVYPQNGSPPRHWFTPAATVRKAYDLPMMVTEFGYASYPQSGWLNIGVDEPSQAKGILNALFSSYDMGIERAYIYELVDQKPDPNGKNLEMHMGLFDNKFRKKIVAHALRNVTQTLKDNDPKALSFETRPINLELTGMPAETAFHMAIEKASGETWLVLWNEALMWDRANGKPAPETRVPVKLSLKGGAKAVAIRDPMNLKAPTQTLSPSSQLNITLLDHPILIKIVR